jgi:hypothetical protein
MTSAEFQERYHLVRQVTDGPVESHHAVATTGAVVMVHMLDSARPEEIDEIFDLLGRLHPDVGGRVLESTHVDGRPVIVTRFLAEFRSLREWLEEHARDPAEGGSSPVPFVAPLPSGTSAPPGAGPGSVSAPPIPSLPEERQEPGEFTRLFRAQRPPGDPEGTRPAEMPAPPGPEGDEAPGEFTQLFRAHGPPAPQIPPPVEEGPASSVAPPSHPAPEPSPPAPSPPPSRPPPPPPPPTYPAPPPPQRPSQPTSSSSATSGAGSSSEGPGEFTRWFARQTGPGPDTPAGSGSGLSFGGTGVGSPGGGGEDWRSRLGSRPGPADVPRDAPLRPPPPPPLRPGGSTPPSAGPPPLASRSASVGPGEYTRIFSTPDLPRPATSPARPPTSPSGPKSGGPSRTLLLGGLAAIFILATVAVVLFAVLAGRGSSGSTDEGETGSDAPAATAPETGG